MADPRYKNGIHKARLRLTQPLARKPSAVACQLTAARANALPSGKKYDPYRNGFACAGLNRYDFSHNGLTARLTYKHSLGQWRCTCDEIGLDRYFDRYVPALEIRATLEAVLGGSHG